ncbi:ROK family protein [uncultured Candidatus Puniceispirillum sp.]|jgi:fructokinase|uniref:ROK family protein n=3 Tax=Candidatus Puniceispirillum TaxID=767891 RepID=UPI002A721EB5|nr:ROK family protein [Candidatus Puniceispirillum sp.]
MRLGLDIGSRIISAAILSDGGEFLCLKQASTPADSYLNTLSTISKLIADITAEIPYDDVIGVAVPGFVHEGVAQNSFLDSLNDKHLQADLQASLGRHVVLANSGACFTLWEARHGRAKDVDCVFGMLIDDSSWGGLVIDNKLIRGRHDIAANWSHIPLPWPVPHELDGHECWCGRAACLDSFVSARGMEDDYFQITNTQLSATAIATAADAIDIVAESALQVLEDRIGRATALIINMVDPDVIVLGGAVGRFERLLTTVPRKWPGYIHGAKFKTQLVQSATGDNAVVAGAALLNS